MVLFSLELFSISGSLYSCITAQDLIFDYFRLSVAQNFNVKTGFLFSFIDLRRIYHGFSETSRHAMKVISNRMQKKYKTGFPVELCALDLRSLSCLSLLLLNLAHTIQTKVPVAASPGKYISIFFWDQEKVFLPAKENH